MQRISFAVVIGSLLIFPALSKGQGKLITEWWEAAYLQGRRAGYAHKRVHEIESGQKQLYRTAETLVLNGKRFTSHIQLRMDVGSDENQKGKVVGVFMRHYLGRAKMLEIRGRVDGKKLILEGKDGLKPAPWNDKVIGLRGQYSLFKKHRVNPGAKFDYLSFEPSINVVIRTFVAVKEFETVELLGGKARQRLLRVEITPQKVQNVQLPTMISWLDKSLTPIRSEVLLPGLGLLTLYRTTKAEAIRPVVVAHLPDIGFGQLIRLKRRIFQPYNVSKAVYRMTIEGERQPGTALSNDLRQSVKNVKGDSFELHSRAGATTKSKKVADEFLQSSYFINSKNTLVKKLADQAVGFEQDPWKKSLAIEKWVKNNMRGRNHEAMSPADHVAKTLQGDCSEFAMLMAAMCRAQGIPSKTAIGLIYADSQRGPAFSYHMWTEVWINGQWFPLDATLGRGYVGATHIKITDHSWHETRSLTPMLPLLRVLGKVSIEVVSTE